MQNRPCLEDSFWNPHNLDLPTPPLSFPVPPRPSNQYHLHLHIHQHLLKIDQCDLYLIAEIHLDLRAYQWGYIIKIVLVTNV